MCPFDEESFAGGDCAKVQLPPATADRLKAWCWNEAYGCTFVGTLQAVLAHYEQECTFHSVTCPRCNGPVLQRELPSHYRAGCRGKGTASATGVPTSPQGGVFGTEDIGSSSEDFKAPTRNSFQDLLPAIQSKMNEVLQEARSIYTQVEAMSKYSTQSEERLRKYIQDNWLTISQKKIQSRKFELAAQLSSLAEGKTSTTRKEDTTNDNKMPWGWEVRHILRKLEMIATESHAYLELLHARANQQLKSPFVEYSFIVPDDLETGGVMSPLVDTWERDKEGYVVSITNIDQIAKSGMTVPLFTGWYCRDSYLQVSACGWSHCSDFLTLYLRWGTTKQGSCSTSPKADVCVKHPDYSNENFHMKETEKSSSCDWDVRADFFGFHQSFDLNLLVLKDEGFVRDGKVTLAVSFKFNKCGSSFEGDSANTNYQEQVAVSAAARP